MKPDSEMSYDPAKPLTEKKERRKMPPTKKIEKAEPKQEETFVLCWKDAKDKRQWETFQSEIEAKDFMDGALCQDNYSVHISRLVSRFEMVWKEFKQ